MRARACGLLFVLAACSGAPVESGSAGAQESGSSSSTTGTVSSTTTTGVSVGTSGDTSGDASGSFGDASSSGHAGSSGDAGSGGTSSGGSSTGEASTGGSSSGNGDQGEEQGDQGEDQGDGSSAEAAGGCRGASLPEAPPAVCSTDDAVEASIEVSNDCDFAIEVFWVDYECDEMSYGTVAGGDSLGLGSFETHPWRIRAAASGELILEIPPLDGDTQITVQ